MDMDEPLFALPDSIDEEKGPYADLIDHITRLRAKLLNDSIELKEGISFDEITDDLNERYQQEFFEGVATHCYRELSDILEYVPEGFELDHDEHEEERPSEENMYDDLVGDDVEEDGKEEILEQDETMRWDSDDDNMSNNEGVEDHKDNF